MQRSQWTELTERALAGVQSSGKYVPPYQPPHPPQWHSSAADITNPPTHRRVRANFHHQSKVIFTPTRVRASPRADCSLIVDFSTFLTFPPPTWRWNGVLAGRGVQNRSASVKRPENRRTELVDSVDSRGAQPAVTTPEDKEHGSEVKWYCEWTEKINPEIAESTYS